MAPLPFLITTIIAITFLVVILEQGKARKLTEKISHALPRFFQLLALRILHIPNRAFEYANFLMDDTTPFVSRLPAIETSGTSPQSQG